MSLPPELLIMIFEYVDAPLRAAYEEMRGPHASIRRNKELNEFITRGSVFPYPHVDVCRYWANIILSEPRFWTNAVVFIGPREKVGGDCIGGAETIFGASRSLPFDVTIRSTTLDPRLDPAGPDRVLGWRGGDLEREQADVVSVLKVLAPHIRRCRSLSIYTLLAGAMPLVYRHLNGPTPLLGLLTFQTDNINRAYRGRPYGMQQKVPVDLSPISSSFAPPLDQLIVDGVSFRDIHKHHAAIRETYGKQLTSLAIANYAADRLDSAYSPLRAHAMVDALNEFENLEWLTLARIRFDYEEEDDDDTEGLESLQLNIRTLVVEDMDDWALEQLFFAVTFPELEHLWFKACWPDTEGEFFSDPDDLPLDVPTLAIEGVADVNLARALRFWDVHTIHAIDAPAFNDTVLAMLAAPREEVDEAHITPATEFGCNALRVLSISAAPGISAAGLKRMVASRNRWVNYADPTWRTNAPVGPAILEISLFQLRGQMVFTAEDEAWLRAHVSRFQFDVR